MCNIWITIENFRSKQIWKAYWIFCFLKTNYCLFKSRFLNFSVYLTVLKKNICLVINHCDTLQSRINCLKKAIKKFEANFITVHVWLGWHGLGHNEDYNKIIFIMIALTYENVGVSWLSTYILKEWQAIYVYKHKKYGFKRCVNYSFTYFSQCFVNNLIVDFNSLHYE